jgi:hypothetical protein
MSDLSADLLTQALGWFDEEISPELEDVISRRAISNAYYALFHALVEQSTLALLHADLLQTPIALVMRRSFEHATMRNVCNQLKRPSPNPNLVKLFPNQTLPSELNSLLGLFPDLQDLRHQADYDAEMIFDCFTATTVLQAVVSKTQHLLHFRQSQPQAFATFAVMLLLQKSSRVL